jgi:hypothetical protein
VTDTDKPKIEELPDEVALWKAHREARRADGFDIAKFYTDLAEAEKQTLTSPGAREDFTELCETACLQPVLATIVALLRYSPLLERFWTEMVGRPDNREQAAMRFRLSLSRFSEMDGRPVRARTADLYRVKVAL